MEAKKSTTMAFIEIVVRSDGVSSCTIAVAFWRGIRGYKWHRYTHLPFSGLVYTLKKIVLIPKYMLVYLKSLKKKYTACDLKIKQSL